MSKQPLGTCQSVKELDYQNILSLSKGILFDCKKEESTNMHQSVMDPEHDEQMKPVKKPCFIIPTHRTVQNKQVYEDRKIGDCQGLGT